MELRRPARRAHHERAAPPGALRWVLAAALGLVAWAAMPSPAGADASGAEAYWLLDEPRGSTALVDSSGNAHDGRLGSAVQTGVVVPDGVVHRFPLVQPPAGATGHVHTVPDHPSLDPGRGGYAVSLRFRTSQYDSNVVQKGQSGVAGGFWKVEVDDGRLRCLFRGSGGDSTIATPQRVDDGQWHTGRCVRRDGRLRIELDGVEVASRADASGLIANSWGVAIGGKSSCNQVSVGCDLFAGELNWVRITDGIVK